MRLAISLRWVRFGSALVSSVCQSLDRSTSARSSELRVCAVVVMLVRKLAAGTGVATPENTSRSRWRPGELSRFRPSVPW